jgi:hypothetical protein
LIDRSGERDRELLPMLDATDVRFAINMKNLIGLDSPNVLAER